MSKKDEQVTPINNEPLRSIIEAVNSLKFGQVQVTIHDSRVVQVERIERVRFGGPGAQRPSDSFPGKAGDDP